MCTNDCVSVMYLSSSPIENVNVVTVHPYNRSLIYVYSVSGKDIWHMFVYWLLMATRFLVDDAS